MTRLNQLNLAKPVTIEPMRTFPPIRDLVTDVSWNYRAKKSVKQFAPKAPDAPDGTWRLQQVEAERVQEFRKCIECFLCQDVCHVLREHHMFDQFVGPRHLVYSAALEMNPIDKERRASDLRHAHGIGYCNITKCCTKVCPEGITITDNAIIPLKERVVDQLYDPVAKVFRLLRRVD
jgi:succinate dehydrogenase / fumarate reductase iron-sulfur subunit